MNINFRNLIAKILIIGSLLMPTLSLAASQPLPGSERCGQLRGLQCDEQTSERPITDLLVKIIQILLAVAFLISVLFLVYGGFQYVFSAGSDDKAKAGRKTVLNSLIGIAIIILSYVIVQIVVRAVQQASSGTGEVI